MTFVSTPGRGTSFVVRFALADMTPALAPAPALHATSARDVHARA